MPLPERKLHATRIARNSNSSETAESYQVKGLLTHGQSPLGEKISVHSSREYSLSICTIVSDARQKIGTPVPQRLSRGNKECSKKRGLRSSRERSNIVVSSSFLIIISSLQLEEEGMMKKIIIIILIIAAVVPVFSASAGVIFQKGSKSLKKMLNT